MRFLLQPTVLTVPGDGPDHTRAEVGEGGIAQFLSGLAAGEGLGVDEEGQQIVLCCMCLDLQTARLEIVGEEE